MCVDLYADAVLLNIGELTADIIHQLVHEKCAANLPFVPRSQLTGYVVGLCELLLVAIATMSSTTLLHAASSSYGPIKAQAKLKLTNFFPQ